MAADCYTELLGLPRGVRPPDHYTLLGLQLFCRDLNAVETAVRRRLTHLDEFAVHPDKKIRDAALGIMGQVARARTELVNSAYRLAYDRKLAQSLGVVEPTEVPSEDRALWDPGGAIKPFNRVETDSLLSEQSAPRRAGASEAARAAVSAAVQFERVVWDHLRRWKLNDNERRLLLSEAFAMGMPATDALKIIRRMDKESETVARHTFKLNNNMVITLAAALLLAVGLGIVMFFVAGETDPTELSGRGTGVASRPAGGRDSASDQYRAMLAKREEAFAAAIARARELIAGEDTTLAKGELDKAIALIPDDPRLKQVAAELADKRDEIDRRVSDLLGGIRLHIEQGRVDLADKELARAGRDVDDRIVADLRKRIAAKRAALDRARAAEMLKVRGLIHRRQLEQARAMMSEMSRDLGDDKESAALADEIDRMLKTRDSEFLSSISSARASLAAGKLDACARSLSRAETLRSGQDEAVRLREDLNKRVGGRKVATLTGHSGQVLCVAFSPDGKRLVSGGSDKSVKLWDVPTVCPLGSLPGHSGPVRSVAFSPDGKRIASAGWDKTVMLWDAASGRIVATLRGHAEKINTVVFSPDSKRLASGGWGYVKTWDAASGRELAGFRAHKSNIWSLAFSPNGKRFASASRDKTIRIWTAGSKRPPETLEGHKGWVCSAAFAPDNRRLVSGGYDMTVKVWNAASGRLIKTLVGHKSYVYSVAFSPNGKLIASGSWDKTIKIWSASKWRQAATLTGHEGPVNSIAFSPDGKRLASCGNDKTVRLWNLADWIGPQK